MRFSIKVFDKKPMPTNVANNTCPECGKLQAQKRWMASVFIDGNHMARFASDNSADEAESFARAFVGAMEGNA